MSINTVVSSYPQRVDSAGITSEILYTRGSMTIIVVKGVDYL